MSTILSLKVASLITAIVGLIGLVLTIYNAPNLTTANMTPLGVLSFGCFLTSGVILERVVRKGQPKHGLISGDRYIHWLRCAVLLVARFIAVLLLMAMLSLIVAGLLGPVIGNLFDVTEQQVGVIFWVFWHCGIGAACFLIAAKAVFGKDFKIVPKAS